MRKTSLFYILSILLLACQTVPQEGDVASLDLSNERVPSDFFAYVQEYRTDSQLDAAIGMDISAFDEAGMQAYPGIHLFYSGEGSIEFNPFDYDILRRLLDQDSHFDDAIEILGEPDQIRVIFFDPAGHGYFGMYVIASYGDMHAVFRDDYSLLSFVVENQDVVVGAPEFDVSTFASASPESVNLSAHDDLWEADFLRYYLRAEGLSRFSEDAEFFELGDVEGDVVSILIASSEGMQVNLWADEGMEVLRVVYY